MNALLAAVVLLQADSAEEAFRRIGKTLEEAKSIRVRFAWEGSSKCEGMERVEAWGTILLKEGNRASLAATITEKGASSELRIVSDGSTVKTRLGPGRMLEGATPKNFESGLKRAVHRLGGVQAVLIAHKVSMLEPAEQEEALDMEKRPSLSAFRKGPDDGDFKTLLYSITSDGPETVAEIKLWYDSDTFRLAKRTITIKNPTESVFTEKYKDWSLDGDLENEEFALPSVKSLRSRR